MQKIGQILKNFNPVKDKYVSREFQTYGIYLSEALDDPEHRGLYIKLAKTVPRIFLDRALSFAIDSRAKKKGALFMWKLTALRKEEREREKKK